MAAPRTHRDTLVLVLAILGGACLTTVPLAIALDSFRGVASLATLAGCGLGSWLVASSQPHRSLTSAVVGGALAALLVRGGAALFFDAPTRIGVSDLATIAFAAGAAWTGAAFALARGRAWTLVATTGLVSLAVCVALQILLGLARGAGLFGDTPLVVSLLLSPALAGAVTVALLDAAQPRTVALGWLVITAVTFVSTLTSQHVDVAIVLVLSTLLPVGAGPAGAALYLRLRPRRAAGEDLPSAQVVR